MKQEPRIIRHLYLQWASVAEAGMTLELIEGNALGEVKEDGLYPAARIVADSAEDQWLEIYPDGEVVRIQVSEIEKALKEARAGVHGEKSFL